jgi:hypothetical protein
MNPKSYLLRPGPGVLITSGTNTIDHRNSRCQENAKFVGLYSRKRVPETTCTEGVSRRMQKGQQLSRACRCCNSREIDWSIAKPSQGNRVNSRCSTVQTVSSILQSASMSKALAPLVFGKGSYGCPCRFPGRRTDRLGHDISPLLPLHYTTLHYTTLHGSLPHP